MATKDITDKQVCQAYVEIFRISPFSRCIF
jgi:hypothetical protein